MTIFFSFSEPVPPKIATSVGYVDLSSQLTASLTIGQNAKVLYGAEVSIECPAQGEPSPSVIWSGEMGFEMKRRMTLEMNEGRTLKIMQASKNATGLYKCIAANIFGSDYAVSKLLVVGKFLLSNVVIFSRNWEIFW